MGEGTGIPAALGAILMGTGKIKEKGVLPPEGCVNPMDVLELARTKVRVGDKGGLPIAVEHVDASGRLEEVDLFSSLRG